jgi:2-keto-4-pentenoate hydratase/2-oxohepta-3-ene-1,7-dioic acid hydratase in catechol pathway
MMSIQRPRTFTMNDGVEIPIGTFYCIGRNYSAHAKEMGASVPDKPLVFLKPSTAYIPFENAVLTCPAFSKEMHHEVEIAIVIGRDIPIGLQSGFEEYIAGYGIALDLTLRDIQKIAKEKGEPWAISKGFAGSAPVSTILPFSTYPHFTFSLSINGEIRQKGDTNEMERTFEQLLAFCHSIFHLKAGDCILTGTPEGVGPLHSGDIIIAQIDDSLKLQCTIA